MNINKFRKLKLTNIITKFKSDKHNKTINKKIEKPLFIEFLKRLNSVSNDVDVCSDEEHYYDVCSDEETYYDVNSTE